ncbi:MAG: endosialidase [Lachnospiraceae bacterium]|nr:endosialidase [Lachnospiraceae bacterium]
MPGIESLIQVEQDETISFGNYSLNEKSKKQDFEHQGDLYKVKTFYEITKLERNGMFVYESVPGTTVSNFTETDEGITCRLEGYKASQVTVQLEENTAYKIYEDGEVTGEITTNISGKLGINIDLEDGRPVELQILKVV